jgi:hypothetical protein
MGAVQDQTFMRLEHLQRLFGLVEQVIRSLDATLTLTRGGRSGALTFLRLHVPAEKFLPFLWVLLGWSQSKTST